MEEYSTQELLQSILIISDGIFASQNCCLLAVLYGKSILGLYCMPAQSIYPAVPVCMKTKDHTGS